MKAKSVRFGMLVSHSDYSHSKCEIEYEVEDGENENDVLEKAKDFVHIKLGLLQVEMPF
jgi:hypothetical protein